MSRAVLGTQKLPQGPLTTLGPFSGIWKGAGNHWCCSWGQVTVPVTLLCATRACVHTSVRSPEQHEPADPPLQGRRSRGGLDPGSRGTAWKHHSHPARVLPGIRRTLKAEDEGRAPAPARPAPATTAPSGSCCHQDAPSHLRDALSGSNAGLAAPAPPLQLAGDQHHSAGDAGPAPGLAEPPCPG